MHEMRAPLKHSDLQGKCQDVIIFNVKRKKFITTKDKTFKDWLSAGGRKDSKKDFLTLLKRAVSV